MTKEYVSKYQTGQCESCSNDNAVITIYDYEERIQLDLCNDCYSRFATSRHRVIRDFKKAELTT